MVTDKKEIQTVMVRLMERANDTRGDLVSAASETLGVPVETVKQELKTLQLERQAKHHARTRTLLVVSGVLLGLCDLYTRLAVVSLLNATDTGSFHLGSAWVVLVGVLNVLWVLGMFQHLSQKGGQT